MNSGSFTWSFSPDPHENHPKAWLLLQNIGSPLEHITWALSILMCNMCLEFWNYRKTSNIRRILFGKEIVDHSDVVGASPVGAAPTTSSFST